MGVDWALSTNWGLETRYPGSGWITQLRICRSPTAWGITSEIPAQPIADILHRPVSIPCVKTTGFSCTPDAGGNYLQHHPVLRRVSLMRSGDPPLRRRRIPLLQAADQRQMVKPRSRILIAKLRGNYAGLVNTDPTDGEWRTPQSQQRTCVRYSDHDVPAERKDRRRAAILRPSQHGNIFNVSIRVRWAHMVTISG